MNKRLVKKPDGTFLLFENDFISQQILQGKPWEPHFREVISLIKIHLRWRLGLLNGAIKFRLHPK
jgi:hypothetical protein